MTEENCSSIRTLRRLKPYPSYKDSGIRWVGKIPSHWITKRIKYVAPASNERVYYVNSDGTYLALEHIESETGRLLSESTPQEVESTTSLFKPGDVLFGKLRPYLAKVLLCNCSGACSMELLVLRSNGEIYPANLAYQLRSRAFIRWVDSMTYGTKMPRANPEQVMNTRIVIASPEEQRTIVSFLDYETAKIDALIEKKERLIELLQEKRTSLITRAVTKGLDPNVPMKDSGVEWLGKIPAHWDVRRIKHVAPIRTSKLEAKHEQVTYLGLEQIESWTGRLLLEDLPETIESVVGSFFAGDVLLGKLRPYLAKAARPEFDGVCTSELLALHPTEQYSSGYLFYCLINAAFIRWLNSLTYGTKMPRVSPDQVGGSSTPLPSLLEQRAIVAFLDRETAKIDALVTNIREAIDRLKEYRTALISAAVTGKIDVRNLA